MKVGILAGVFPVLLFLCACATSPVRTPGTVEVSAEGSLSYEQKLQTQRRIIELQQEQIERQEREILELKRQKELNKRTRAHGLAEQ